MNFTKLAAAVALATVAMPGVAIAQEAPPQAAVEAGMTVYGNDGIEIGTIESVENDVAVLVVDGMKAPIPANVVSEGEKGPTINATKAQIVGMIQQQRQQAAAARDQALIVGAPVVTVKGEAIGPVESINGDKIVLKHGEGFVALMRDQFAVANGQLVALVAMADVTAAVAANTGATTDEAEGTM
ncbi:PRC-barrel domain-containing protein [Pseudoblastomonas halimionae]|uniref:PRC-barrel domain-containing protein n=1 Tax=Alteriqipengyuania halimionae TaxID=1926630 RepID=A0A6I4U6K7_9SPHN|nr:PRC-barrel domain-containing protein [Alteriqipengyuania halimionae]MXP09927.1 hypothetical protein [Alteriqipengyuania halimionae]